MSAAGRGSILLTLAQLWHALSGYVIFITGARILGEERFGDFSLVIWTMTTLEVFVVAGVPRAVSFFVARQPEAARRITRAGMGLTFVVAVALAVLYAACGPAIAALWEDRGLLVALWISAFDFVAFVGFAVLTQAANGLQRYGLQATIWLAYSTLKVLGAVSLLALGFGIEGGVSGYVAASLLGSLVAALVIPRYLARARAAAPGIGCELRRFGLPVAIQALALMALLNVDLWAAKRFAGSPEALSHYTAAGTLARALYFVFIAFGDALFPAVARERSAGAMDRATKIARDGLGLLLLLLLPAAGLAVGAAEPVVVSLFGADFAPAAATLRVLAPSAVAWTLVAVLTVLLAGAGRPWRAVVALGGVLALTTVAVFLGGSAAGAPGTAVAVLASSLVAGVVLTLVAVPVLGAIIPVRTAIRAGLGALAAALLLRAWAPAGWWVFPYGALVYAVILGLSGAGRRLRPTRGAREGVTGG